MVSRLQEHQGLSKSLLWIFSVVGGAAVANLYYCQSLLNLICSDFRVSEFAASGVALSTQVGYTAGLLLIIPLADLCNRRKLLLGMLSLLSVALFALSAAPTLAFAVGASVLVGLCSVVPQLFIPLASQFSTPQTKSRNVSIVLSGALTGVLAARVVAGMAGEYWGWRSVFFLAGLLALGSVWVLFRRLPAIPINYSGNYFRLMASLFTLVRSYARLRIGSLTVALSFGSFLAMWSCLAFHLVQPPFCANNFVIGLLGLTGVGGPVATLWAGRRLPRWGGRKLTCVGCCALLLSWACVCWGRSSYWGIVPGLLLVSMGAQCVQISCQAPVLALQPQATNRLNTVFMTSCFLGGSIGTLLASAAWTHWGWTGVCLCGMLLSLLALLVNLLGASRPREEA